MIYDLTIQDDTCMSVMILQYMILQSTIQDLVILV